jgi:acetyl-CoA carboxylase biotin carboxyl carrier protein
MDLEFVERLLQLLADSKADEIEIEEDGKRVKVVKHSAAPVRQMEVYAPPAPAAAPIPSQQTQAAPAPSTHHEIRSPIVGTFYRSPAPDAAPFVEIGTAVRPGSVLCIVEAMKLMNEIESDIEGKIVKVLVENGQPIEYDQPLFLIEKS